MNIQISLQEQQNEIEFTFQLWINKQTKKSLILVFVLYTLILESLLVKIPKKGLKDCIR